MAYECPILTATRTGKKISSNPCNDCAFFGKDNCPANNADDMSEAMLMIAGAFIGAVKEAGREYANKGENVSR